MWGAEERAGEAGVTEAAKYSDDQGSRIFVLIYYTTKVKKFKKDEKKKLNMLRTCTSLFGENKDLI